MEWSAWVPYAKMEEHFEPLESSAIPGSFEVRFKKELPVAVSAWSESVRGGSCLILGSGRGSNFEALVRHLRRYGVACKGLFCDRPGALILERAKSLGVRTVEPPAPEQRTRRTLNDAVLNFLQEPVDFILLAGYMRVLPARVVRPFAGKMINVHPSLLPDYPGLSAIERAFADRPEWMGITLHWVNEGVDQGPMLCQGRFRVSEQYTLEQVEAQIHAMEHLLYPWTVLSCLASKQRSRM
ncbi:MAG: phosphoribosylglycinamide formyltransferase [Myxococcota bacterium]